MSKPVAKECEISVTTGGKIQIVKFNLANDFGITITERFDVPKDWSQEELDEWLLEKTSEIKGKVDHFAQQEQDALLEAADWYES